QLERAESRHAVGFGEVPLVLGKADEIADGGISAPRASKCRTGQFLRNTGREEGADVACRRNRFDRRQGRGIEGRQIECRRRRAAGRRTCLGFCRFRRLGLVGRTHLGRALALRPPLQKILRPIVGFAHLRSFGESRRAMASGLARSRFRLTNECSTWCSAMKSATVARTTSGIGTASTRLVALSVKASPSPGSAVAAVIS